MCNVTRRNAQVFLTEFECADLWLYNTQRWDAASHATLKSRHQMLGSWRRYVAEHNSINASDRIKPCRRKRHPTWVDCFSAALRLLCRTEQRCWPTYRFPLPSNHITAPTFHVVWTQKQGVSREIPHDCRSLGDIVQDSFDPWQYEELSISPMTENTTEFEYTIRQKCNLSHWSIYPWSIIASPQSVDPNMNNAFVMRSSNIRYEPWQFFNGYQNIKRISIWQINTIKLCVRYCSVSIDILKKIMLVFVERQNVIESSCMLSKRVRIVIVTCAFNRAQYGSWRPIKRDERYNYDISWLLLQVWHQKPLQASFAHLELELQFSTVIGDGRISNSWCMICDLKKKNSSRGQEFTTLTSKCSDLSHSSANRVPSFICWHPLNSSPAVTDVILSPRSILLLTQICLIFWLCEVSVVRRKLLLPAAKKKSLLAIEFSVTVLICDEFQVWTARLWLFSSFAEIYDSSLEVRISKKNDQCEMYSRSCPL